MKNPNPERSISIQSHDWSLINIAFANQTPLQMIDRDMVDKCGNFFVLIINTNVDHYTTQTPFELEWYSDCISRLLDNNQDKDTALKFLCSNGQLNHFWSNSISIPVCCDWDFFQWFRLWWMKQRKDQKLRRKTVSSWSTFINVNDRVRIWNPTVRFGFCVRHSLP
jgi:hypothetical protein